MIMHKCKTVQCANDVIILDKGSRKNKSYFFSVSAPKPPPPLGLMVDVSSEN